MLVNKDLTASIRARAKMLAFLRDFLNQRGFIEVWVYGACSPLSRKVETPMMSSSVGGAVARPFVTRSLALSQDFFLRISPELYLKVEKQMSVACLTRAANDRWRTQQGLRDWKAV
jgi:lysyl-tRNA synthetase class 2